jgi:hypothetical protein
MPLGRDHGELDVFYTRHLSEFLRLRTEATWLEGDADATRVAVQLVAFLGPHGHGLHW